MEVSPESLLSDTPSSSLFLCSAQDPSHRPQFLWRISPTCPAVVLSRCFPRRHLIAGGTHLGARTAVPPVAVSPRSSARRALSLAGFPRALPARLRAPLGPLSQGASDRGGTRGRRVWAQLGGGRGQEGSSRRQPRGAGGLREMGMCPRGRGSSVGTEARRWPPCFGLGRTAGSVCL